MSFVSQITTNHCSLPVDTVFYSTDNYTFNVRSNTSTSGNWVSANNFHSQLYGETPSMESPELIKEKSKKENTLLKSNKLYDDNLALLLKNKIIKAPTVFYTNQVMSVFLKKDRPEIHQLLMANSNITEASLSVFNGTRLPYTMPELRINTCVLYFVFKKNTNLMFNITILKSAMMILHHKSSNIIILTDQLSKVQLQALIKYVGFPTITFFASNNKSIVIGIIEKL